MLHCLEQPHGINIKMFVVPKLNSMRRILLLSSVWVVGFLFVGIAPNVLASSHTITVNLPNPFGTSAPTPQQFIGTIIQGVLGMVGVLTLIMFLWGGFIWLFSFGEPERVKKGLNTMLWTGAGLVAIFGAAVVIRWFLGVLTNTATQ